MNKPPRSGTNAAPSPSQGEGWDGGKESIEASTPTLTRPLPGGGNLGRTAAQLALGSPFSTTDHPV